MRTPARHVVVLALLGCGPSPAATGPDASETSSAEPSTGAASMTEATPAPLTTSGVDTTAADTATVPPDTSTGEMCDPPTCDGLLLACTDGIDNDGDGLIDLDDPHCMTPCDDDEASFHASIPSGDIDCKFDCFFDANTGMGNDGCIHDVRCDPLGPGEAISCSYTRGNYCVQLGFPTEQTPECLAFCEPTVPPGCDCFGCCEVQTDAGPIDIWLNWADETCSLDTPENCPPCTSSIEQCGNPCDGCEICFGQTEPPPGCDTHECSSGPPCTSNCDCADGGYCKSGCCWPTPPM